ncbi:uncharacterized protein CTRU02_212799 [Colletotrichum truncatum]|uniref:Uncharacterized protein n=1 Tax=Colletotrichum truncatum TaxID=5467 RepID=A0ACC3YIW9_COLTU
MAQNPADPDRKAHYEDVAGKTFLEAEESAAKSAAAKAGTELTKQFVTHAQSRGRMCLNNYVLRKTRVLSSEEVHNKAVKLHDRAGDIANELQNLQMMVAEPGILQLCCDAGFVAPLVYSVVNPKDLVKYMMLPIWHPEQLKDIINMHHATRNVETLRVRLLKRKLRALKKLEREIVSDEKAIMKHIKRLDKKILSYCEDQDDHLQSKLSQLQVLDTEQEWGGKAWNFADLMPVSQLLVGSL